MVIHLPIGSLKTRSGLVPVPRCEPSTYQPITDDITTAPSGPVYTQCFVSFKFNELLYRPAFNTVLSYPIPSLPSCVTNIYFIVFYSNLLV